MKPQEDLLAEVKKTYERKLKEYTGEVQALTVKSEVRCAYDKRRGCQSQGRSLQREATCRMQAPKKD